MFFFNRLSSTGALTLHMKTHTGQKDHICTLCGKAFAYAGHLVIHTRIHTGNLNFNVILLGKS